jgi:hypothetical protein
MEAKGAALLGSFAARLSPKVASFANIEDTKVRFR